MMPQFKTTGVMALVIAAGVAGFNAQELRGVGTSPLAPWDYTVGLTPGLAKSGPGQTFSVKATKAGDARSTVATHPRRAAVPSKPPSKLPTKLPQPEPPVINLGNVKPAIIASTSLAGFATLSASRQELIESALALAANSPWLPYVYGGADPALGGLDCSGAMYYVMTQCGLSPPRSSAGQYDWLRDHQQLHRVASAASDTNDPSLAGLRPGDLLFWASGPWADDATVVSITHVAMYLGRETKDGWQIMINSTDGRSYRGIKANGYGVYDFRLPPAESKSKLVGYGPPPGIAEIKAPAAAPP